MFCEARTETDSPTYDLRNLPHGRFGQFVQRYWKGGLKLIPIYQLVDFGKVTLVGRTLSVTMVTEPLKDFGTDLRLLVRPFCQTTRLRRRKQLKPFQSHVRR